MAMARVNRPSIMVYGGTIRAGSAEEIGRPVLDIVSAFQSYGEFQYGKVIPIIPLMSLCIPQLELTLCKQVTEEERQTIVQKSCPGAD